MVNFNSMHLDVQYKFNQELQEYYFPSHVTILLNVLQTMVTEIAANNHDNAILDQKASIKIVQVQKIDSHKNIHLQWTIRRITKHALLVRQLYNYITSS